MRVRDPIGFCYAVGMLAAADARALVRLPMLLLLLLPSTAAAQDVASDALHRAVRAGSVEQVRQMLAAGVDVNARDQLGGTPLLDAAWSGHADMVKLLLDHGAEVNAVHREAGSTALEYAVLTGHVDIVRLLLAAKADVHRRYRYNQTIVHIAAARGHTESLAALCDAGADAALADANGNSPLDEAILHDQVAAVRFLLAYGSKTDGAAAQNVEGHSIDGRGPLHEAAVKGFADLVPVLLAAGFPPDRPDASGQSALDLALAYKNAGFVKALLQSGASLQASQNAAARAMESATLRGQTDIVQLLIAAGFDVNRPTAAGTTYLHDAALKGQTKVADLLLKGGASPEARNATGGTPLHDAALGGSAAVIRLLLDRGAPVDAVDHDTGATPLMLAASMGRREAAALLVARGANTRLRDRAGLTALDRARKAEDADIIHLLQSEISATGNKKSGSG